MWYEDSSCLDMKRLIHIFVSEKQIEILRKRKKNVSSTATFCRMYRHRHRIHVLYYISGIGNIAYVLNHMDDLQIDRITWSWSCGPSD